MKRWIACFLTVCIVCTAGSFVLGTDVEQGTEQTVQAAANLEFLNCLGILVFEDDEFDGSAEMTRGEFARQAALLLNESEELYETLESPYTDVDSYTDGVGAILMLTERKLFNGYGDGTFRPDDGISTDEAATVATRMLGYSVIDSSVDFLRVKSSLGVSEIRPLTYSDAVELFVRLLESDCLELDYVESDDLGTYYPYTAERTFLEVQFGVEKRTGRITANRFTSLESPEGTPEGYVEIDGELYVSETMDLSGLLGYRVKYYIRESEQKELEVVYAQSANTQVTRIAAEDLLDYDQRVLRYEENGRRTSLTIPADVDVIYNGRAYPRYTAEQMMPKQGSVTALEINGKTETILIEDIKDEVVSAATDDTIYFRSGKKLLPEEYKDGFYTAVDEEGEAVSIAALTEGMVVSLTESADFARVHLLVCTQSVTGIVAALSEDEITIGETVYEASPYLEEDLSTIVVGQQYRVSLNAYGKIVRIRKQSSVDQFAYLIEVDSGSLGSLELGLLTQDSQLTNFPVASRVQLNGITVSQAQLASALQKNGAVDRQLLRIRFDDDGAVKRVETAANHGNYTGLLSDDETLSGLRISGEGTNVRYKTATRTFNGLAPLDANTVVFFVQTGSGAAIDSDHFYTGVSGYLTNDTRYTFTAYTTESGTKAADALVIYNLSESSNVEETAPLSIVLARSRAVDADGDEGDCITVLKDNKELRFILDESIDADAVPGASSSDTNTYQLSPGDAIRFGTNKNGKISIIRMVYDVADGGEEGKGFSYSAFTTGSLTDLKYRLLCGPVYNMDNGILQIAKKDLSDETEAANLLQSNLESFQSYSSCTVYRCIRENKSWKVEIGSTESIVPYMRDPDGYSTVVLTTQYGTPILMVVYQND